MDAAIRCPALNHFVCLITVDIDNPCDSELSAGQLIALTCTDLADLDVCLLQGILHCYNTALSVLALDQFAVLDCELNALSYFVTFRCARLCQDICTVLKTCDLMLRTVRYPAVDCICLTLLCYRERSSLKLCTLTEYLLADLNYTVLLGIFVDQFVVLVIASGYSTFCLKFTVLLCDHNCDSHSFIGISHSGGLSCSLSNLIDISAFLIIGDLTKLSCAGTFYRGFLTSVNESLTTCIFAYIVKYKVIRFNRNILAFKSFRNRRRICCFREDRTGTMARNMVIVADSDLMMCSVLNILGSNYNSHRIVRCLLSVYLIGCRELIAF